MEMSMSMDMGTMTMDMGTMTSMAMDPSSTASAAMTMTTDYTPGMIDSKGYYVPTDDEVTAYQAARIPWADQVVYGYYTLGFLGGILVIYMFLNAFWRLRIRYRPRVPFYRPVTAALRAATYPRLKERKWVSMIWTIGALGPNLILLAGLLFASALTWINKYYYFAPFYGSHPLYLRSEWIAMATLPFVMVLGSKRNIISILTGISHEKLQVLHQGAALNFTYMSLVHTIAAIVRACWDYGFVMSLRVSQVYVSGFVALAPLLVLFVGALPPFRKKFYEAFYWVHIIMVFVFLGAMFWHGYKTLDSDAYMITSIVLFLSSVLYRLVAMVFNNPILHSATLTVLPDSTVHVSIPTPTINWHPGQHVFLRFFAVRPLESHPFSFCNVPVPGKARTMEFIIRPQAGFTSALWDHVAKTGQKTFAVLVDGPYGGVGDDLRGFDSVMICTGGSGITWAMSCLQDVLQVQGAKASSQAIRLVWAVPRACMMTWFDEHLQSITKANPNVQVDIFITDETENTASDHDLKASSSSTPSPGRSVSEYIDDESKPELNSISSLHMHHVRPDLPALIKAQVAVTEGSLVVAACGPARFLVDCANEVSRTQLALLKGQYPNVSEVYLKSEEYGW